MVNNTYPQNYPQKCSLVEPSFNIFVTDSGIQVDVEVLLLVAIKLEVITLCKLHYGSELDFCMPNHRLAGLRVERPLIGHDLNGERVSFLSIVAFQQ